MNSFLCSLPLITSIFSCPTAELLSVGYIEGEYVQVAPLETARIKTVAVERGDRIKAGDLIALLDTSDLELVVGQAKASLKQTNAELENLRLGKRPEEIAVVEAELNSARLQQSEAARNLKRLQGLAKSQFVSAEQLDSAEVAVDIAGAKVQELEANLAVARLPARENEIRAAESMVERAQADLDTALWRLNERSLRANADGEVVDLIHRQGELASPSSPVVSFLPEGAVKVVGFVSQESLSSVQLGAEIELRCDGCEQEPTAVISYVASEPEYTPPVIYSIDSRQSLVYRIEARPLSFDADQQVLKPGQIVDIYLPAQSQ